MAAAEQVVVGIDIGTTTITSLALGLDSGEILAKAMTVNDSETTSADDRKRGRSEWDTQRMLELACGCLLQIADKHAELANQAIDLGITGQQHGGLVRKIAQNREKLHSPGGS